MKEEAAASGISVDDVTELESFIDEITEREKMHEGSRDTGSEAAAKKADAERQVAVEIRQEAMERFSQTRKRLETAGEDEQEKKDKRTRRSGNDALDYMREKNEKDSQFREEELALKKKQQEQEAARQAQLFKQQNSMFEGMQEMQMAMMQQQQQQTAAMMVLVEGLLPKQS